MRSEDFRADTKRPFTGEEYSSKHRCATGARSYINGERVKDVGRRIPRCAIPPVRSRGSTMRCMLKSLESA